jgi:hypothetical protein
VATISITVPDGTIPRIVDALCRQGDYTRNARQGETRAQFAERMNLRWYRHTVLAQEGEDARTAAWAAVYTNPEDPIATLDV